MSRGVAPGEFTIFERDVIRYASQIGAVLLVGAAAALGFAAARLFAGDAVDVMGVTIPVGAAWLVLGATTLVHVWLAFFFIEAIHRLWRCDAEGLFGRRTFDEIKVESNFFLRGMVPRAQPLRPGSRIYRMDWGDPSTWVSLASVLIAVLAVLPWHVEGGVLVIAGAGEMLGMTLFAAMLAVTNWLVGGTWAVALSQLTVAREDASWHIARTAFPRRRG